MRSFPSRFFFQAFTSTAALTLASAASALHAQNTPALQHTIDSLVAPYLTKTHLSAISIAVIRSDSTGALSTIYYNYGTVAKGSATPVSATTLFEIGSDTKVFTAMLLASLVLEGRVKLSDSLQRYLPKGVRAPEFRGQPITLLDLATHRSALPRMPDNMGTGPLARMNYTLSKLYDFLNHYQLTRAPGAEYEYSNLGFGVLGSIEASLMGISYDSLIIARIANPLNLPDTRLSLSTTQRARVATGYLANGNAAPAWNNTGPLAGGGGLLSTATDLAKFITANIDPPHSAIGAALQETQTLHRYTAQPGKVTGLAWEHMIPANTGLGFPIFWKSGSTAGFASWMGFCRGTRTGIVILTNGAGQPRGYPDPVSLMQMVSGKKAQALKGGMN